VLARLIQRTIFSVSPDETRVHVNSALFEWSGDSVRMVTTDGHRLSKAEESGIPTSAQATMLIPLRALHELRRLCDEAKGEGRSNITISQAGANAFFSVGDTQFSVKLVDATFPPYKQVIPQSSAHSVTAPRHTFGDALKAVSLASSDRTGAVKLSLAQGVLRITSESPESGNGFDEISVDYSGPDLVIGFNAKYFQDVLGALDAEQVVLSLSGELDPAVLTPATGAEGSSFVGVIMPMRI
jgi:DNA polymerase-3 subunit beta